MGRLLTALNPLTQSSLSQAYKAGGDEIWQKLMGGAKKIVSEFSPRAFFKGLQRAEPGKGFGKGNWFKPDVIARRQIASDRRLGGMVAGAWAGLNVMDPDSGSTSAMNTAVMGSAMVAASPGINSLAAKYGGEYASKISGGYKIAGAAFMANRILGIV